MESTELLQILNYLKSFRQKMDKSKDHCIVINQEKVISITIEMSPNGVLGPKSISNMIIVLFQVRELESKHAHIIN